MNIATVREWQGMHTIISPKPIRLIFKVPFAVSRFVFYVTGDFFMYNTLLNSATIEMQSVNESAYATKAPR